MRALKLVGPGQLELQEVPVPEIGDDDILVKVAAAGLCHSDLHILHQGAQWPFFGTTMGHETSGHVEAKGANVTKFDVGDPVLVRAVWACGECRPCRLGRENACAVNGSRSMFPLTPGLAVDGGMADYIRVAAQHADPLGEIDPDTAAPLADAGLTPMHAIKSSRHLLDDGATAVVIGFGGLGHMAVQILAADTDATIIVIEPDEAKRAAALKAGAAVTLAPDADVVATILDRTDGYGVDVVYDFVGAQGTLDTAAAVVAPEGAVRVVGLADGALTVYASLEGERLPWGVDVQRAYGGTSVDQTDVLRLVANGSIAVETVTYPLTEARQAFDDLEAGRIQGRAVLIP
ncbi:alcohol dehydrogenase catalytic domain-containing protein [Gordonia sp. TBRC 11910]|uniref:Alcohol dehydrogenase catalytic domain-containing protein n=1 Tax=Gordonia asplenii TaxID=2725283 RepID=A0A848KYC7_9ACTN|nr:alcohol dehydrogenase catalytic domain-containing protein [Gordonia asplenii]NMO03680.1 alcohol dehydrogenase catalytic domain-containing protein [Gordonia asplenii]